MRVFELGSRGPAEGDDKNALDRQPTLEHEPHVERSDRPGFSGTRASLDEGPSGKLSFVDRERRRGQRSSSLMTASIGR